MKLFKRRNNLVFVHDLSDVKTPITPDGFVLRLATPAVIDEFFQAASDRWRRTAYLNLLTSGGVGFVLTAGPDWAAVGWLAPPGSPQPEHLPRSVTRHGWWMFYDHTKSHFRNRGLHKYIVQARLAWLYQQKDASTQDVMTDINPQNTTSMRSYVRSGFTPSGRVTSLTTPLAPGRAWGSWNRTAPHGQPGAFEES